MAEVVDIRREYHVVGFEGKELLNRRLSFKDLITQEDEPFEFMNALQEEIEDIIDLGVGETLFVDLHRDHQDDRGVIIRLK